MIVLRKKTQKESEDHVVFEAPEIIKNKGSSLEDQFNSLSSHENQIRRSGSKNYKIEFRTESQEHGFNFPFQVGTHGDDPEIAKELEMSLSPCLLYTSPSPRDLSTSRMPSSA